MRQSRFTDSQILAFIKQNEEGTVAVGIPVTRYPPHRSVRALLTHTAPTESI